MFYFYLNMTFMTDLCFAAATGDTLFQMAEVHRQIQVQLEDVVRPRSVTLH